MKNNQTERKYTTILHIIQNRLQNNQHIAQQQLKENYIQQFEKLCKKTAGNNKKLAVFPKTNLSKSFIDLPLV